jgi:hypothetical protein
MIPETDNLNKVVMLAPETKSAEKSTYVISPGLQETQQKKPPYGWGYFRFGKIQHTSNIVIDGKYNRDLVFYTPALMKSKGNVVGEVFIVDPNKPGGHSITPHPPKIEKIIYHDIGKDKEFWIGRIKKSKSAKKDSSAISRAEKILVHYLTAYKTSSLIDLLNERLKKEPQKAFGVVNRWFKKNGKEYEKYLFPFNLIPDIILWESSNDVLISSDKLYIEKDVE